MSSLPTDIFYNITNFLPNDDITDLMLMSRTFNALVTPRLKKIDKDRANMNQSLATLMPLPTPENKDVWVTQLNPKRFLPIGSVAKKRMKELFANNQVVDDCFRQGAFDILKKGMSLERFDDATFMCILSIFATSPEFCQEYNASCNFFIR
ncbi:hypothetical protein Ddc_15945 [Ditylenchus destructor]|nr:hypothetical protein Ddc_15945 [Ditylenchus destructor]